MTYLDDTAVGRSVHTQAWVYVRMSDHRNAALATGQIPGPPPSHNDRSSVWDSPSDGTHDDILD